ncbi:major facilitator superfamily domain-containing protein [Mycena galopus ATCC 62051]|nr:major facilitator superfamily domain-containing protein [Mycena galopus ATCC 62051]
MDQVASPPRKSTWRSVAIAGTCTAAMIVNSSNNTSVAIALPTIGAALHARAAALQWLVSAYPLSSGCLLLFCGHIADVHGRKRVFVAGSGVLFAFTLGCGFVHDEVTLAVLRGLQGIGGAATIPAALGILAHEFPPSSGRARAVAFSSFSAGAPLGGALGMVLGGLVTQLSKYTWRAQFFLTAAIAFATLLSGIYVIPPDPPLVLRRRPAPAPAPPPPPPTAPAPSAAAETKPTAHTYPPSPTSKSAPAAAAPELPPHERDRDTRTDWPGAILSAAGLILLVFVLGQGSGPGLPPPRMSANADSYMENLSARSTIPIPSSLSQGGDLNLNLNLVGREVGVDLPAAALLTSQGLETLVPGDWEGMDLAAGYPYPDSRPHPPAHDSEPPPPPGAFLHWLLHAEPPPPPPPHHAPPHHGHGPPHGPPHHEHGPPRRRQPRSHSASDVDVDVDGDVEIDTDTEGIPALWRVQGEISEGAFMEEEEGEEDFEFEFGLDEDEDEDEDGGPHEHPHSHHHGDEHRGHGPHAHDGHHGEDGPRAHHGGPPQHGPHSHHGHDHGHDHGHGPPHPPPPHGLAALFDWLWGPPRKHGHPPHGHGHPTHQHGARQQPAPPGGGMFPYPPPPMPMHEGGAWGMAYIVSLLVLSLLLLALFALWELRLERLRARLPGGDPSAPTARSTSTQDRHEEDDAGRRSSASSSSLPLPSAGAPAPTKSPPRNALTTFLATNRHVRAARAYAPPPLLPPSLFARRRARVGVVYVIALLQFGGFMIWAFWVQLYYQIYIGYSPVRTVVRLTPMFVTGLICNVVVALIVGRVRTVWLLASGTLTTTLAPLLFALIRPAAPYWAFGFPAAVCSVVGADFLFAAGTMFVADSVGPGEQSVAGGVFQTMTQLGTSLGVTASTILFNHVQQQTTMTGGDTLSSYHAAMWMGVGFGGLATLLALVSFWGVGVPGGPPGGGVEKPEAQVQTQA